MSADAGVAVKETDERGITVAAYACLSDGEGVAVSSPLRQASGASYLDSLLNVFLPAGYPHSVTEDYIEYQLYDSLQAFSSSIAGLLSSRAVLQGVGVGDATASPTAALLLNVLQESMGRVATILFAHRLGTSLEPECKMYRFAADILNDSAMVLDCLSPALPKPTRVAILSLSSVLRALCGVAAGSSKASLSAHFARRGNLGELNAKDSSQETVISLIGMLAGSVVVSYISSPLATWIALLVLIAMHLATNYAAVRAVNMSTLNRQRANIVFSAIFDSDTVLTPAQASRKERIFEKDGVLRRAESGVVLGTCQIGVSLEQLLLLLPSRDKPKGTSATDTVISLQTLLDVFEDQEYLLYFDPLRQKGCIVLKVGVSAQSQLKAWSHAFLVSQRLAKMDKGRGMQNNEAALLLLLRDTLSEHSQLFEERIQRLKRAGWQTDIASLETRSGTRICVSV